MTNTNITSIAKQLAVDASPLLSSDQLYMLIMVAILFSLGALCLLLGGERIIMALVSLGKSPDQSLVRYTSHGIRTLLPLIIYGITIVLIVFSVLLLAVQRIVVPEGALGILASVAGYVLGKKSSEDERRDDTQATQNGTKPS